MLLTINLKLWKIIGDDFSDGRQSPSDALNNWPLTKIHQGNNPFLDIFAWIRISRHCIEDGNGRRRSWHILLAGEVQWTSSLASWWNKWGRVFIYLTSQYLTSRSTSETETRSSTSRTTKSSFSKSVEEVTWQSKIYSNTAVSRCSIRFCHPGSLKLM